MTSNCYYCNSTDHEDIPCPKRTNDANRFVKSSPYINSKRVHCKTSKYTIYCGRPSRYQEWKFGNPFRIGPDGERSVIIAKFGEWLKTGNNFKNKDATEERRQWILNNIHSLKGEILGCWCFPYETCHCDILIKFAYDQSLVNNLLNS